MAVNLSPVGGVAAQFFTNTGAVLTGGKLYTYAAGTTTPQATYTNSSGGTAWTNPIVLDAAGRVSGSGEIWIDALTTYKFVLKDSTDVLIATYDNVSTLTNTTSALVSYTAAGTGAVTTTVQNKLRETISVKDFGAVGDGVTDDTTAIQTAVNAAATFGNSSAYGATVFFPSGKYIISSTINLPGAQFVSLIGEGKTSIVSWNGGASNIMFSMDDGSDESQVFVEKLRFVDPVSNNGVTGFSFCQTPGSAVVNVTFRQNLFQNLDKAISMNQETDQMLIDDNYFLTYYEKAVEIVGYCANIYVKNNHFRDGKSNTYAVHATNAVNIVIESNTVQNGNNGTKGFYFTGCTNFKVTNTYFEVSAGGTTGDGPFLTMYGSEDGYVADNYTTGAVGESVMIVDTNCRVITFGNHRHSISGGTPLRILEVDGNPVGISVIGTFDTDNVQITPFSGNVDYFLGYTNSSNNTSFTTPLIYASKPVNQYRDQTNIAGSTTADLINFGTQAGAWQIYALNTTEGYWSISFVSSDGTTAAITNTYQSNANLVLSVTGNKLQVANGVTATRSIKFSATRIF